MPNVGALHTCRDFCAQSGADCLGGYEDLDDTRTQLGATEVACDLMLNDHGCRCGVAQ